MIEERKKLRRELLETFYNSYFENKGNQIRIADSEIDSNVEKQLAMNYLDARGFIDVKRQAMGYYFVNLTPIGIDEYERQQN